MQCTYNIWVAGIKSPAEMARTVAENFIRTHGRPKFLRLVELLLANSDGPTIAREFGVTRQRVHQWKNQLGHERVAFDLHPEIESIIGITSTGRKTV